MIKALIQQEDITMLNIDAPNTNLLRFLKIIVLDLRKKQNIITGRDFNIPLMELDRQQRNTGLRWNSRTNGPKRHLKNILQQNCKIYVLLISI